MKRNMQSDYVALAQNHRIAEVGRDLWGSSDPNPGSSRVTQSRLPWMVSRHLLNFPKEGGSVTALGNLCHSSVSFTVNKCFLIFGENSFRLCTSPLVLNHFSCLLISLSLPAFP